MTNVILIIINIILSVSIYFSLTGCGFQPPEEQTVSKVSSEEKTKTESESINDEDEPVDEQVEESFNFENSGIAGEYMTTCLLENGFYLTYELEITKNQTMYMAVYQHAYNDINCSFSAVATTYRKFGARFQNESDVDLTVHEAIYTLYSSSEVLIANQLKLFGFSNWVKDVPKDIKGLRSSPSVEAEAIAGTMYYLTYRLSNDIFRLSFIESKSGEKATMPSKRTTDLGSRKFVKIK